MHKQPIHLKQKSHSQLKKIKWLFILIVLLLLLVAAWKFWQKKQAKTQESFSQWSQPVPVRVVGVQRGDLQLQIKAIGTVIPANSVNVQSQVSGILQKLYVREGQNVQKGQILAQIDPAPFQVALAQAQGTQQQNLAQLQHAQTELKRYQAMYAQDSIAQQQVDQQQSLVNQLKGQMQANQAQVDAAKLQLSYTRIYAPINGRVGFHLKDVGNLIQANETTGFMSITQIHPIYIQFSIAENYLDLIRLAAKKANHLEVSAWDRTEQKQLALGQVHALDNQIDLNTGTLKIKAIFSNTDDALFPHQFVNVRLIAQTLRNTVHLASDTIQHGAKGPYVYIVNKDLKAEVRMLKLGLVSQGQTEIIEGLQGNERVVLEGIDRLSQGQEVQIIQADASKPLPAKTVAG